MKLLFLGDLFYDYDAIEKDIMEISKYIKENGYLTILNLEGPISLSKLEIKKRGEYLKQDFSVVDILKLLNVHAVSLANNHSMDFDFKGLQETMNILTKNDIKYFGAGVDLKSAIEPVKIKNGNEEILLFSFGWNIEEVVYAKEKMGGCAPRNGKIIIENIRKHKKNNSNAKIICMPHWGFEFNKIPLLFDIKFAHELIDNGVDYIFGGHPHVIQPYEIYNGKYIFYSLGNFYFSSYRDGFDKKCIKSLDKMGCNYGLCVGLNNTFEIGEIILINYDSSIKETKLKIDQLTNLYILNDKYTNMKKYKKLYYTYSNSFSPFLTDNKIFTTLKIYFLLVVYKIYGVLSKNKRMEKIIYKIKLRFR